MIITELATPSPTFKYVLLGCLSRCISTTTTNTTQRVMNTVTNEYTADCLQPRFMNEYSSTHSPDTESCVHSPSNCGRATALVSGLWVEEYSFMNEYSSTHSPDTESCV